MSKINDSKTLSLDIHSLIVSKLDCLKSKTIYVNYLIDQGYSKFAVNCIWNDPMFALLVDKNLKIKPLLKIIKYYALLFQLKNIQSKVIYFDHMIKKGYEDVVLDSIMNDRQLVTPLNRRLKYDVLNTIIIYSCRYIIKSLWEHNMLEKHIYDIILDRGDMELAEYCFYDIRMFVEDSVILPAARSNCLTIFSSMFNQVPNELVDTALKYAILNSSIDIIRFCYENYENTMKVIEMILKYGSVHIFENIEIYDPTVYINPSTIEIIVKKGYIDELMIYISRYDYLDLQKLSQIAIINQHLEIIIYLHTIFGDFFNTEHINTAIRAGNKFILMWLLHNTNAEFEEECVDLIRYFGHTHMFKDITQALKHKSQSQTMKKSLFGKFKISKPNKKRKRTKNIIQLPTKNTKRFI